MSEEKTKTEFLPDRQNDTLGSFAQSSPKKEVPAAVPEQTHLDDGHIEKLAEYLSPEDLYRDLIDRVRKYHPSDDISLIEKAYRYAAKAHEGQKRKSGEPYIIHPL